MVRTDESAVSLAKPLNVAPAGTDHQNMPLLPAADPTATPSSWSAFVERYGVTATVGLLAVIPTLATAIVEPATVPASLPALRFCALVIALAAMVVLSFRETRPPALIPLPAKR